MERGEKPASRVVDHRYGKAGVRLLRLDRSDPERHRLFEASVEIRLEGDFVESYAEGDNARVLPTDTMKNTVYALARQAAFTTPEELALLLARHFVDTQPQVQRAIVEVAERPWLRHGDHADAFVAGGAERDTARATVDRDGATTLTGGIDGLVILKSSRSGFEDFPRDRYTTLRETADRILSTRLQATWEFTSSDADAAATRRAIQAALLDTFAEHDSRSVQHTLYWMGDAALAAAPTVARISLRMPNKHYLLADLQPFGLDNPNHVFVPIDEPAGMIEATLERD